jgi:hypothetical protein
MGPILPGWKEREGTEGQNRERKAHMKGRFLPQRIGLRVQWQEGQRRRCERSKERRCSKGEEGRRERDMGGLIGRRDSSVRKGRTCLGSQKEAQRSRTTRQDSLSRPTQSCKVHYMSTSHNSNSSVAERIALRKHLLGPPTNHTI